MALEEKRRFLLDMEQQRGYTLDLTRTMLATDFDWVKAFDTFAVATYSGQRTLGRKTKELLQTVVFAALRADVGPIQNHVELALKEVATPQEVLEALETVVLPMGLMAFGRGIQTWAAAVGIEPIEPVD